MKHPGQPYQTAPVAKPIRSAENLLGTIAANLDNDRLTDAGFRDFIRRSLSTETPPTFRIDAPAFLAEKDRKRTERAELAREPEWCETVRRLGRLTLDEIFRAVGQSHPEELQQTVVYAADAIAMEIIGAVHKKRDIVNVLRWAIMGCPGPNLTGQADAGYTRAG